MDRSRVVTNHLKFYRQMNGLSIRELGARIGCSGQWISKLENSEIAPAINICYALAELFGLSVYDLFWFTDQPEPAKKLALIEEKGKE